MDFKKKYNDVLERVTSAYETADKNLKAVLAQIFPELQESEDERIRKNCIHFLNLQKQHHASTVEIDECIDWLCIDWFEKKYTPKSAMEAIKEDKIESKDYNSIDPHFGKSIDNIEQKFHDGDFLVCKRDQMPFIFKGFLDKFHPTCPVAYCGICEDGSFDISTGDGWWTDDEVQPATEEQREQLLKAISDAGYEWDAEKKELREIEKEPENYKEHLIGEITDLVKDYIKQGPTDAVMKEALKTEYEKGRADAITEMHKGWTEEDEGYYNSIIEHLKYSITNGKPETYRSGRLTDWLKSLKEKYTLYTWKPSVKQMNALDSTLQYSQVSHDSYEHLNSLYNDLTKLTPMQ